MKTTALAAVLVLTRSICLAGGLSSDEHTLRSPGRSSFAEYYRSYRLRVEPNAPGYALPLDMNDIVNLSGLGRIGARSRMTEFDSISGLISQNGFAFMESPQLARDDMVEVYESVSMGGIPLFITADSVLHLYHMQFDETLKEVEERVFVADITNLTNVLLVHQLDLYSRFDGDLKEAARRNLAYLGVAQQLMAPDHEAPQHVAHIVSRELAKVEAHRSLEPSDIFIYSEDYSQYLPRGHYTRSEALRRYFMAMTWYGRMGFLLKGGSGALVSEYDARIQTLQALLLAASLRDVRVDGRSGLEIWDHLYSVTAFYVGLADDLTPYDYLCALDQVLAGSSDMGALLDSNNLFSLKMELALLPSPQIYGGTGNIILPKPVTNESLNKILYQTKGMRLMGQRFVPDSYLFQHLVFPDVGAFRQDSHTKPFTAGSDGMGNLCRGYVRGLDAMAVLGSREALKILIEEGDTQYTGFWQKFGELRDEVNSLNETDWHASLYWSWLYALGALLDELPEGYPNFMRTDAWQRRQLHAALASWTQLRHDAILYAKQSYVAGGVSSPPPGYIEPLPHLWARLLAMTRMTSSGLDDLGVLSSQARERLTRMGDMLQHVLVIVEKQLTNKDLSTEDQRFINTFPSTVKYITAGMPNQQLGTALVADVHTNSIEGLVVEEAVGNVDLIVVACPMSNGKAFLAIGPVLSYYEFKQPMGNRLSDDAWRRALHSSETWARPQWYQAMLRKADVLVTIPGRGGKTH